MKLYHAKVLVNEKIIAPEVVTLDEEQFSEVMETIRTQINLINEIALCVEKLPENLLMILAENPRSHYILSGNKNTPTNVLTQIFLATNFSQIIKRVASHSNTSETILNKIYFTTNEEYKKFVLYNENLSDNFVTQLLEKEKDENFLLKLLTEERKISEKNLWVLYNFSQSSSDKKDFQNLQFVSALIQNVSIFEELLLTLLESNNYYKYFTNLVWDAVQNRDHVHTSKVLNNFLYDDSLKDVKRFEVMKKLRDKGIDYVGFPDEWLEELAKTFFTEPKKVATV